MFINRYLGWKFKSWRASHTLVGPRSVFPPPAGRAAYVGWVFSPALSPLINLVSIFTPARGLTGIAASPPARLSHPATLRSIYIVKFYLFFISLMHYILYILTLSISNSNTFCFVFRKIYKKNTSLLAIGDIISEYFIYFCISRVISWSWPLTHQAVSCLHWI